MQKRLVLALLGLLASSAIAQTTTSTGADPTPSADDSTSDDSSDDYDGSSDPTGSDDSSADDSSDGTIDGQPFSPNDPNASYSVSSTPVSVSMPPGPTVSLFMYGTDPQPLVASVVDASPSATTYLLGCAPGTSSDDCGTYNATITAAPSAWDASVVMGDAFSDSVHCEMTSSTIPGRCTEVATGSEANFPGTSIYTPQSTDYAVLPVVVTAGTEKLASTSATSTGSGGSGSASATASQSGASSGSKGSNAGASSTGSGASGSASATGNAADIRGAPMFGAVVGVGAALMMF
ncbi:MAG: hypothetical protein Q9159_000731 [Coniocarpon cinnabarinum]